MKIEDYINKIGEIPDFLKKYLDVPCLLRLKDIGYFCGMDYASLDIYNFSIYISRYHHSLSTALITWRYSKNKKATIAALFHDIATPIFSHVIDYMNQDFVVQESTEEKTGEILANDLKLRELLKEDNLTLSEIDFKKYSIVDNERPKLCADRIDGIILTSLAWTKDLKLEDVDKILNDMIVVINENGEEELSFKSREVCKMVYELNRKIDLYCHTKDDTYMMLILADITRKFILKKISYDDLYKIGESRAMEIVKSMARYDCELRELLDIFLNIKKEDIPDISMPIIKKREIKPLVEGKRYVLL